MKSNAYYLIAMIVAGVVLWASAIAAWKSASVPAETIIMGHIESPPYYFTNSEGKSEGSVIDILDKVMKHAGVEWKASSYPLHRIINLLESGQIHLWVGLPTLPEFDKIALIGNTEIGKVALNAYWIGDKPPIMTKEDLRGKSLLILKEYSYGGWIGFIKDPANKIRYNELYIRDPAFELLMHGRADYLLEYETPANRRLENVRIPNLKTSRVSTFGLNFVVSKSTPNAKYVLNRLEQAYYDLLQEGKVEKF